MSSTEEKLKEINSKWGVHVPPGEGKRLWTVGGTCTETSAG